MHKFGINTKTYTIFSLCLIVFLSGFYIFQVREYTQASFDITQYQLRLSEISKESKNLKVNFSETNSLASLETMLKTMDYQEAGQIRYIRVAAGEVAAIAK